MRARSRRRSGPKGCRPTGGATGRATGTGPHSHSYHKVLYCVSGSIVFHTPDGDVELGAGDRLELPPGTPHSATVGPSGCECMEASR